MAATKYYDGIRKAQAETGLDDPLPAFDMERMRKQGLVGKLAQRFLENPRWALALLRRFKPIVKVGPFVVVTRAADVRDVLERHEEFETPFGPEMEETTRHTAVLLGLPDGELYRRQKSAVLSAFPPDETRARARAIAERHARQIMAQAQPGFDAVKDLLRVVPARICREYYGLVIDDERAFSDWAIALSTLYFGDYFGDRTVRELALSAAAKMAALIDRSIDRTIAAIGEGKDAAATPLGRLVARHLADPAALSRLDVRALMIGMVSGFVPTNVLAAGNALDTILDRPEALAMIERAAASGDSDRIERIVMEAMRFKPINIGPVRYVVRDAKIGGKERAYAVKQGETLWVSTLSAMFDESEVEDPETFNPDRPARDSAMVFGHGLHWCIGAWLARAQISACFEALFAKPAVRRAPGAAGRLRRLGPFPESLGVTFHRQSKEMFEKHALTTIACALNKGAPLGTLREQLARLGNPAIPAIADAFRDNGDDIHFCSVAIVCRADPREEKADDAAHLVIEFSGDGREHYCIESFARAMEPHLRPIVEGHVDLKAGEAFAAFLKRHVVRVGAGPFSHAGATFSGAPGHSVARIREEAALEKEAGAIVAQLAGQADLPPLAIVRKVREAVSAGPNAGALKPARSVLETTTPLAWLTWRDIATNPLLLALIGVILAAGWFNYFYLFGGFATIAGRLAGGAAALVLALVELALVIAALGGALWAALRYNEARDPAPDRQVDLDRYDAFAGRENAEIDGAPAKQNHLTGLSTMKPGLLRRLLLRVVFAVVAVAAKSWFRPGYLADINTIHFARWVKLPGTDRLLFLSNYGGSWESYLEDFITKANYGLTGVWSNTLGFPRTKNLFFDGATDGDRFKRWARMQQIPTLFWYVAYPHLNTRRIRINSAIRQGLAKVATDAEARDWLSLFGALPRPVKQLESDDIQGLFFGPYGPLPYGRMLAVSVPEDSARSARRRWLGDLSNRVSFGDRLPADVAVMAAFGPDGLARLGVDAAAGDEHGPFPVAFAQGMDAPLRARVLDDSGPNAPSTWEWGSGERRADAVVVVYGRTRALANRQAKALARSARANGMTIVRELALETSQARFGRPKADEVGVEPFGFADGISQPVVEGTPRARSPKATSHRVAAGEFLFGYPDGRDRLPPTLLLPPDCDPLGVLSETIEPDGSRRRDFGRNGSFLVVRQLEQDVDGFAAFCHDSAAALSASQPGLGATPDWVGAKVVGRWKDGSSLVRNPDGKPARPVDNDFLYGDEDPQGLRCPLGSHVRRSNPRDSLGADRATQLALANRHRILRVGRPYADGGKKGLLFMCLNADIERQFEFVQQTWVAAGSFHGLRDEKDPLIGRNAGSAYTVPTLSGGVSLGGIDAFVRTRGGGYFFMPGKRAMTFMLSRLA